MNSERQRLRIGILGEFIVFGDGGLTEVPTLQVSRVGTMLAAWPCRVVERSRIINALWGEHPPPSAINAVQVYTSKLRQILGGDAIRAHANGYIMDVEPEHIDEHQFQEWVQKSAAAMNLGNSQHANECAIKALSLWRDLPFQEITDLDLIARRERLVELRDQATETILVASETMARSDRQWNELIAAAKEQARRLPLRENGHAVLIRALTHVDRVPEAIAAYREAVEILEERVGVQPGAEIEAAYAAARATRSGASAPTICTSVDDHLRT